jgi:hypothetical protein
MTPDDRPGEEPTKPLPVDPGPTEPIIAPHVPVANLSTAPTDPVGAAAPLAPRDRSRAFMWGLVAAVALLGILLIVILTVFLGDPPTPAVTPTPSSTPSVAPSPSQLPPEEEAPSEEPQPPPPAPEPTTPPEPTDPPDPEPTGTPAAQGM